MVPAMHSFAPIPVFGLTPDRNRSSAKPASGSGPAQPGSQQGRILQSRAGEPAAAVGAGLLLGLSVGREQAPSRGSWCLALIPAGASSMTRADASWGSPPPWRPSAAFVAAHGPFTSPPLPSPRSISAGPPGGSGLRGAAVAQRTGRSEQATAPAMAPTRSR